MTEQNKNNYGINGKIVFISHEASRTGAPILLRDMLQWIKDNTSISFEILLKQGGELTEDFQKIAPCTTIAGMSQPQLIELLQRFHRENVRLIFSNTVTNGNLQAFLAQLKIPQICHIHELDYAIKVFGEENFNNVKNCTAKYIAPSESVKKNLVENRNISPEKIEMAYEFIPLPDFSRYNDDLKKKIRAELNIPEDALLIGGAGTVEWRKGTDLFFTVSKYINKRLGNKVHFAWLGNINSPDLFRYNYDLEKTGLTDLSHILGRRANHRDYIYAYDVFVMPSREEPFGVVNLEAAILEKPIVCFEGSGGPPEFVQNDIGFVVPYLDTTKMGNKIIELLENPELRQQMGKKGAEKVKNIYNADAVTPGILKIIAETIR